LDILYICFRNFYFAYAQSIAQTYAGEKVARDLRRKVVAKIAEQNYTYIQEVTPSKLLTNLTSDIDHIKTFVGQAVVTIISSIFLIVGAAVLMILIDWKLAFAVLAVLPLIMTTFAIIFGRLKVYFTRSQEVIDWLNKIINESVLGSAIIRVFNSKDIENKKFVEANTKARDLGIIIVNHFAITFPIIGFMASLATLVILLLGGHFIIIGTLSIGEFTAFIAYLGIIIFPVIMIGFMSGSISSASASYIRIVQVLQTIDRKESGTIKKDLNGDVEVKNVSVTIMEKNILKDISFKAKSGSRTAIIGPTAAGKTQLMYILMGILHPTSGQVFYDDRLLTEYNSESLHNQVALVFQDSIMFNLSLRENIAFSTTVTDADLKKALDTAELSDFVETLPGKLDALVMERGTSLSGGQKQRIMLARALALNPRVLLLDDLSLIHI
jgi:ATP-binding cassette subfamily B protein